jgi:hypothetical protein
MSMTGLRGTAGAAAPDYKAAVLEQTRSFLMARMESGTPRDRATCERLLRRLPQLFSTPARGNAEPNVTSPVCNDLIDWMLGSLEHGTLRVFVGPVGRLNLEESLTWQPAALVLKQAPLFEICRR